MRGQFIVGIEFLKCPARLGAGIAIIDNLRITNDSSQVSALKSRVFDSLAGTLEVNHLKKADLLIYSAEMEFPDVDGPSLVANILHVVRTYLSTIWIIKDNSAYFDRGYFVREDGVFSNTQLTGYFNADGGRRTVNVHRSELEAAKHYLRPVLRDVDPGNRIPDTKFMFGGVHGPAHKAVPLHERYLGFVDYSRQSIDLPFRIAMACSALEVLFSTSTVELSHRVSERVAFLLEHEPVKRQARYNTIKRLYAIRSAFLHGDAIAAKDEKELHLRSREADQTLREVAGLLLTPNHFSIAATSGKEMLEQFHSKILFGLGGDSNRRTT